MSTIAMLGGISSQLHLAPRSAVWGEHEFGILPAAPEISCRFSGKRNPLYELPADPAAIHCQSVELQIFLRVNGLEAAQNALSRLELSGNLLAEELLFPLIFQPLDEDPETPVITFPRAALLPEFRIQCASEVHPEGCLLTFGALPDPSSGAFFALTKR